MDPLSEPTPIRRFVQVGLFVISAALAAVTLRVAWERPVAAAGMVGAVLAIAASRYLARRKLRRLLLSGDVPTILERWSPSLERIPYAPTMAPLMTATAFTAYGWIEQARAAIAAAERGPAWDAALEHRLFLDSLLLAFEGDRDAALDMASRLERLPQPAGRPPNGRGTLLRSSASALARAFAHKSLPGDRTVLERASEASPLVFWAMRYAAAIVAIDDGDRARARELVEDAPPWPEESSFRAFHDEIKAQAG